jgi:glucuronate isomerase
MNLNTKTAEALYLECKDLPINDYHCHLSVKEIFEDKPYDNIAQIWLGGDHYKWRQMRTFGISEQFVTGNGSDY